jgi:hypothetical protein
MGLLLLAGGTASADPNSGIYEFDPCTQFDGNGQCSPLQGTPPVWIGPGAALHVLDTTGFVGFDIVQPVTGQATFQIDGTDAEIIDSEVDIIFTTSLGALGYVATNVTSRIEGAVGTVVGDQIQWSGSQEFIGNGTVNCQIALGLCATAGFADGINTIVEGANITLGEVPPLPTPISLPSFDFTADGSGLLNTGEFSITDNVPPDQFVALEGSFIPEPGSMLLLGPGMLLVFALDRRRARSRS